MDLLREGASARDGEHAVSDQTARWVWDFIAAGYGPGGGHKLVEEELSKASTALRAVQGDPALAPYQGLAAETGRHGHHAALAVLVAAGMVRRALEGGHLVGTLEGIRLARRQALAWLAANAEDGDAATAMADAESGLPASLLAGLEDLVLEGRVHLDRIAVETTETDAPCWSPGIPLKIEGPAGTGRVLVVDDVQLPTPRTDASWRLERGDDAALWEDAAMERLRAKVRELGIRLLVSRKGIPEDLRARLHLDGTATSTDASRGLVARIGFATGAVPTASLEGADDADLGEATLQRRPRRDALLTGAGPTATLEVPRSIPKDHAEAWLRTVGVAWDDPRTVPGGGAWQRDLADALRQAAPHAPGKAPMGLQAAAKVFDDVAVALLRNLGKDPTRVRQVERVVDPYACVRAAVDTGLETAMTILRVDARYQKRGSAPADLRGGVGPSGSPKGMPGDIPPLM